VALDKKNPTPPGPKIYDQVSSSPTHEYLPPKQDNFLNAREYLDTIQCASYLGLSRQFLEIARHKGDGPPYVKLARAVRYRREDLDDWMAQHLRQHTGEGSS
jgi:predicted DNA-binding transcriptional regulator AlpA